MGKKAVTFVVDDERDLDLLVYLDGMTNKSATIREALRAFIRLQNGESQRAIIETAVARATEGQEAVISEAVTQATSEVLARLPGVVADAVRDTLTAYQLSPAQGPQISGEEDPELAARLDAQLADFFDNEEVDHDANQ